MTDPPLPARRFTETDTDAILRRTAELASGTDPAAASRGLTLDEMETLAREAGLSPELVRRAAREVSIRENLQRSPWTGGPRRLALERVVPGELTEEGWEAIVGEAQRTLGAPGFASRVGRIHTWSAQSQTGNGGTARLVTITATSHDGSTTIRVDEPLTKLAGALFGGCVGGLGGGGMGVWIGIGMGVLHSPVAAVGIALSAVSGSYLLARKLYARAAARRLAGLDELLDRLVAASAPGG
jgi:hypothetical protein